MPLMRYFDLRGKVYRGRAAWPCPRGIYHLRLSSHISSRTLESAWIVKLSSTLADRIGSVEMVESSRACSLGVDLDHEHPQPQDNHKDYQPTMTYTL